MIHYQRIVETAGNAVSSIADSKLKEVAYAHILNHMLWSDHSEADSDTSKARLEERTVSTVSWIVMMLLLLAGLALPPLIFAYAKEPPLATFLLALAAFALAIALHFSAVSATICGVYIREQGARQRKLRDIEAHIVTSAHLAFMAGLVIILSAGLFLLAPSYFLLVYSPGAVLLLSGFCKYFFTERRWPRKIICVLQ